ncbi:murein biosynthesis integral membrane protein MurJ [Facklamia sp. P12937]|uniref:murein biosynthesis integral membrane protein MurJ n=1 Tax=Facklamia sp. P12937 TaxID=3421949 RepID=UPI003D17B659
MRQESLIIFILTIISKLFGFIRQLILSFYFGTSLTTDAYLIAIGIPSFFLTFVGAAIQTTYMPIFQEVSDTQGESEAQRFTNNLITILSVIVSFILFIVLIFPEKAIFIFAPGFNKESTKLAVDLLKVSIFSVLFVSSTFVIKGYLQMKGKILVPSIVNLLYTFIWTILVFFAGILSAKLLPYGILFASIFQLIFIIPFLKGFNFRYNLELNLNNKYIKKMLRISLPSIVTTATDQVSKIIDKNIVSYIVIGGISSITFADRILEFIQAIVVTPISIVIYPRLIKFISSDLDNFKKIISDSIEIILAILVPTSVLLAFFSTEIVSLMFGRGAFNKNSIEMTSQALFFYSFGVIGFGLREILNRGFYALKNTSTPMKNSIISVLLNTMLSILLSKKYGIGGITLATSISNILFSILLFYQLNLNVKTFISFNFIKNIFKIIFSTVLMIIFYELFNYFIADFISLNFIFDSFIMIFIYVFSLYILDYFYIKEIVSLIQHKIRGR